MHERTINTITPATTINEAGNVLVVRSLGVPQVPQVDPFLLLDEFRSIRPGAPMAGVGTHPHRGFEAVTVMLAGSMLHHDSSGGSGEVGPGNVQWMTAGRGILHSEYPQQRDGLMWGFQLWVNLPAKDKMSEARYHEVEASMIPEVELGQAKARVIAGTLRGVTGPFERADTDPIVWDLTLRAEGRVTLNLPATHNAFVYPFEGHAWLGGQRDERGQIAVTEQDGETVTVRAETDDVRLLVVAGRPIGEPVVRGGPFVMNTEAEIQQAFADYRAGRLR